MPDRQCWLERGMGGSRYKLTGPDYVACVFDFHYLSIVHINPFRTIPVYSAIESQSFRFGVNLFSLPAPCWGTEKKIFHRDRNTLLVSLLTGKFLNHHGSHGDYRYIADSCDCNWHLVIAFLFLPYKFIIHRTEYFTFSLNAVWRYSFNGLWFNFFNKNFDNMAVRYVTFNWILCKI